jgi:hypothetical protein
MLQVANCMLHVDSYNIVQPSEHATLRFICQCIDTSYMCYFRVHDRISV